MISRFCAEVLLMVFVGASAEAQSILLGEDQSAPFIQAGIVGTTGATGAEIDLGYAFNHHLDLGVLAGHLSMTNDGIRSSSSTLAGQSINVYPIRLGRGRTELVFGLHEAYVFPFSANKSGTTTIGSSVNLKVPYHEKGGIVLRAGYVGINPFGEGSIKTEGVLGLILFTEHSGKNLIGVVAEYNLSARQDSYGIGLSFTKVLK